VAVGTLNEQYSRRRLDKATSSRAIRDAADTESGTIRCWLTKTLETSPKRTILVERATAHLIPTVRASCVGSPSWRDDGG
jgi:hypothetical protein